MNDYKPVNMVREMAFVPCKHISTNDIYSGSHFSKRKKQKEVFLDHFSTSPARRIKPFNKPVNLKFIPVIGRGVRRFDTSNYSYGAKMLEDCLTKYGIILDDGNDYVKNIETMPPVRGQFSGFLIVVTEQSPDHVAYVEYFQKIALSKSY